MSQAAGAAMNAAKAARADQATNSWRLSSLLVEEGATDVLAASMLGAAAVGEDELLAARSFSSRGKAALLESLVSSNVLQTLVDQVFPAFEELAKPEQAATAEELHDKFSVDAFTLQLSGLEMFYHGLVGVVGAPNPNVLAGMIRDHCALADADVPFDMPNRKTSTTSAIEWRFVYNPKRGADGKGKPFEPYPKPEDSREPLPPKHFQQQLEEHNARLRKINQPPVGHEEFIGARLYTGPAYLKYNGALRGLQFESARSEFDRLCMGNKYTTTLHAINSSVVKLSKLTKAGKVYRGVSGGMLPAACMTPNEYGIKGGVEGGLMSTSFDKATALFYAKGGADKSKRGGAAILFEVQMGMLDRGADIAWLSQFPKEQEILFSPQTGMEVRGSRVEGAVQVYEVVLTVNMTAPTIERVTAKLKTSHEELITMMDNDFRTNDLPDDALQPLKACMEEARAHDGAWFNDPRQLHEATGKAFAARTQIFEWMLKQDLKAPYALAFATLATNLEEFANLERTYDGKIKLISELVKREKLEYGAKVKILAKGMFRWTDAELTRVSILDVVDATLSSGKEVEDVPLTRALVVADGGVGAMLRHAASLGRVSLVQALLDADVSPLVADARLNTAIHLAAAAGHKDVCAALKDKGADPTVPNLQRQSAAALATYNGHNNIRRLFYPTQADKEFTDAACRATEWLSAAADGEVATLKKMPEESGPITALMVACRFSQLAAVEALLPSKRIDAQSENGFTALHLAASEEDEEIVGLLLSHDANLSLETSIGNTALIFAASNGHEGVAQMLLKAGAAVDHGNKAGRTALIFAASNGHEGAVQALLTAGAAVDQANSKGGTALHAAASNGHAGVAQMLLKAGAAVDHAVSDTGSTALLLSAQNGHEGVVQVLLTAGAAVDQASSNMGNTALIAAAQNGHVGVVQVLLKAGAAVDHATSDTGSTALVRSAGLGQKGAVQALLTAGAAVDHATFNGNTALVLAAQSGHEGVVQVLLKAGAAVDHGNSEGNTALLYAAGFGYEGVVQALLTAGAAVDHANSKGVTALKISRKKEHEGVEKLLRRAKSQAMNN